MKGRLTPLVTTLALYLVAVAIVALCLAFKNPPLYTAAYWVVGEPLAPLGLFETLFGDPAKEDSSQGSLLTASRQGMTPQQILEQEGLTFPPGSSIGSGRPDERKIDMRNTLDNQRKLMGLLDEHFRREEMSIYSYAFPLILEAEIEEFPEISNHRKFGLSHWIELHYSEESGTPPEAWHGTTLHYGTPAGEDARIVGEKLLPLEEPRLPALISTSGLHVTKLYLSYHGRPILAFAILLLIPLTVAYALRKPAMRNLRRHRKW